MIYVPNLENYQCVIIRDSETIRAYKEIPVNNSSSNFDDYYIHSDYLSTSGVQNFNQYGGLPVCLTSDKLTDNYVYRVDFTNILINFILLLIIFCYPSYYLIKRIFRGKKVY